MRKALLSVSDKTDLVPLAKFLHEKGIELISTGGTAKLLQENNLPITPISEITGNPEAFGGRMKSISFQVSSGLLFRRNNERDIKDAASLNITPIDLVICNLYPFEEVSKSSKDLATLIENIDIGGPTMIRSAAKNYRDVTTLTSPTQYREFMEKFDELTERDRYRYALEAFKLTAQYDQYISNHLTRFHSGSDPISLRLGSVKELRYGENPHQKAWISKWENTDQKETLAKAIPLQGKALSYNNMLDADAAWKCNSDLHQAFPDKNCVTIIKHANPCGVAVGETITSTLEQAWSCDPISSFGSVICFNHKIDEKTSQWLSDKFVEIVIAPDFEPVALEIFAKKKNLRLISLPPKAKNARETVIKSVNGGILMQEEDELAQYEFESVTLESIGSHFNSLKTFGMLVNKYLKSNAITLVAQKSVTLCLAGAGMGQPNRLDSLKMLAAPRAQALGFEMEDLLLISDAFFPFKDSIEVCQEVGIKNILQPGGSIRDQEVIDCCNEFGIAMEFSRVRHFRH